MSRCFPYPPPGYSLPIRGGDDKRALIESIKLQKDKEKPKEERRKERKKEKNDKKEKKDKKRKREVHSNETLDGNGEGKLKKVKTEVFEKHILSLKGKCDESHVDAESSDLTEEHDQPVCVPKPSYSSENSQNSDKRRRLESAANSIKADGSILKIRLSSFKKKEPNSTSNNDVGPSTSGRTEPIGRNNFEFGQKLVKKDPPPTMSISTGIRVPCSTPLEKQPSLRFIDLAVVPNPVLAVSKTSTCKESKSASKESKSASKESKPTSKLSKAELLYKSLLDSWALPAQESEGYDDDGQDWLFQKKSKRIEKAEATSNSPCSLEENLWPPRAQFLPSVDVYALPYTVPF